jgi:hypothetical protein
MIRKFNRHLRKHLKRHLHHVKQIHTTLEKHSPKGTRKAKNLFKFRHPKIIIFVLCIVFAYYIFRSPIVISWIEYIEKLNYAGNFFAGMLLALGFSAPFAIGFFMIAQPGNIIFAALCGALGAVVSDLIVFKFIKVSFIKEFRDLEKTPAIEKIRKIFDHSFSIRLRHYILYIFAGLILVTPLPDEIGVSMLAGLTTIRPKILVAISFVLHFTVILLILKLI